MKKIKAIFYGSLTLLCVSLLLTACGGDPEGPKIDPNAAENMEKAKKVFYAVPSPSELALMIRKTGANFDKKILNSVDNAGNYETIKSKALALGVYGADLSYVSAFDQTQEALSYMNACKKLADGLGITGAIDQKTLERMEVNLNKKDSLLKIIADTYMETDEYLKSNESETVAALVVAGGYIEGLYISVQVAKSNQNNTEILARIAEQKDVMENLFGLLSANKDEPSVQEVITELTPIKTLFDKIQTAVVNQTVQTDTVNNKTNLAGKSDSKISAEQLEELNTLISAIRNKLTA